MLELDHSLLSRYPPDNVFSQREDWSDLFVATGELGSLRLL